MALVSGDGPPLGPGQDPTYDQSFQDVQRYAAQNSDKGTSGIKWKPVAIVVGIVLGLGILTR